LEYLLEDIGKDAGLPKTCLFDSVAGLAPCKLPEHMEPEKSARKWHIKNPVARDPLKLRQLAGSE